MTRPSDRGPMHVWAAAGERMSHTKTPHLSVLSESEIRSIHEASLDILESCGTLVGSPRALRLLEERGLPMDRIRGVVRFSRSAVEEALAHAPASFEVYDRDGRPAFVLGDGTPRIAAGHNAVFWADSCDGKSVRPSTVADVELCARICEHLSNIDVIGVPVMPQDTPDPKASLAHAVRAVVENSRKPVYFSADGPAVNRACIEIARAAFAGEMTDRPYCIGQLSPTSPLFWEGPVLDALEDTVLAGVPLAILPEPNAGVSAPYTLAGLLTMNNAECLSGIVIAELIRPGAKVLYANSWTTTDMRTGAALVGSAETSVCRIAGAQLARFYGIPSHTTAPNSDNHAHDEQNAWEKTLSQFCAIAAGNDLIVNAGMFATGLTYSHEQLVMDDEITALARRIVQGIEVSDASIALDLIKAIGPRGDGYLTADHTIAHLRTGEHHTPLVAVRGGHASWTAAGGKDAYELAQDVVRRLSLLPAPELDSERRARVAEALAR